MIGLPRLYAVADGAFGNPVQLAAALFDGGVQLIQLRHKNAASGTLLDEAEEILKIAPAGARLIINDRADVAMLAGAGGVHLGQDDLPPAVARKVLGADQWVGQSTHTMDQALDADRGVADYIAVGPVFSTATKTDTEPVLGLERLRAICSTVKKPVVAIGGIQLESAATVLECGAASIAVISDLLRHDNISARARQWMRAIDAGQVA